MKKTINLTIKIEENQVLNFESYLDQNEDLISFKILPNTEKLYETNPTFKKLVKAVKSAQEQRDKFINEHNK